MSVLLRGASGSALSGRAVAWSSDNPAVAAVDGNGRVVALAEGQANISASAEGQAGRHLLVVRKAPVATMTIVPDTMTVQVGTSRQLEVTLRSARGAVLTGRDVAWSTSNPAVIAVSAAGQITAHTPGTVQITAASEGQGAVATIVSVPVPIASLAIEPATPRVAVGRTLQLRVIARDAFGSELPGRTVTLSNSHPSIATVNEAAVVTGMNPGTTTLTATAEGKSAMATITVHFPGATLSSVVAGYSHACGLASDGAAYCWGHNIFGQLGVRAFGEPFTTPVAASGGLAFASLIAGAYHTCGLTAGGTAYCWGNNGDGQLGHGTRTSTPSPTPVSGGIRFRSLSGGGLLTCGVSVAGTAYCWGNNESGALGTGSQADHSSTPVAVVSGGISFATVEAGASYACGLTVDGAAYCWGRNVEGQFGNGSTTSSRVPVPVSGGLTFTSISLGLNHACALTAAGKAYCWGRNFSGELGDGTFVHRSTPVEVTGGLTFSAMTVGHSHSCGRTPSGALYCWGRSWGSGRGDSNNLSSPAPVVGGLTFTAADAGGGSTCGVTTAREVFCWGENLSGEVGDGTMLPRPSPTRVHQGAIPTN